MGQEKKFLITATKQFTEQKARKAFIAAQQKERENFEILKKEKSYHGCGKYHLHYRTWDVRFQYESHSNVNILDGYKTKIEEIKEEHFYSLADRQKFIEDNQINVLKLKDWPKHCHDGHIWYVRYAVTAATA